MTADAPYFVVFNVSVEPGYPGDPLSLPREAVDFTVHASRDAALARLLAELDLNLADEAADTLRHSLLAEVAVPPAMCGGSPRRWIADRARVLLARAGAAPDAHASALGRGLLGPLLARELARTVALLRGALEADGQRAAIASLEAAGAAARAARHGAVPAQLARKVTGTARAIGTAAWAGDDVSHLAPALDAILAEMPPAGESPDAEPAADALEVAA